jgi:3-oxoacyl-[acyl-carrier protein] reductase
MMDGLVAGRTAVVTGAAQGIGLAIAQLLLEHGANLALVDLDADRAEHAAAALGGAVLPFGCDVTDEAAVEAVVARTVEEFGSLDIYVNNAGITRDASLRTMRPEDFDAVIDVHLKGTWLGVRAASAVMREAGRGAIVNMSSLSGKSGNPGQTNYSAAKAGIVGLTKAAL